MFPTRLWKREISSLEKGSETLGLPVGNKRIIYFSFCLSFH